MEGWQEIVKLILILVALFAIGIWVVPRQKGGFD
jgi:hypothetical protein